MPDDFLHNHKDFAALIRIVADERRIAAVLVEKDYWIMHCLYGLQQLGTRFELKGGTSLSKGFGIINRFSEDIDIRIDPPSHLDVKSGRNHDKETHVESRRRAFMTGFVRPLKLMAFTRSIAIMNSMIRSSFGVAGFGCLIKRLQAWHLTSRTVFCWRSALMM